MKTIHILAILCFSFLMLACTQPAADNSGGSEQAVLPNAKGQSGVQDELSQKNILHVALGSESHTTLVAAVQATAMEDILSNAGPLTVFAPTNEAFEKLPEGTLETLLKPENKSQLARIIKYHASPGKYAVSSLKSGMKLYQASGHYIDVDNDGTTATIGSANILGTVEASNGLVHVIDAVLLPPE